MTDIDPGIDDGLRAGLERLYPRPDSSGVAIDVWERVVAGDPGTPGRPSDGGAPSGLRGWLPFLGVPLLAGALVFGIATTGLLGRPEIAISTARAVIGVDAATPALDCPGGSELGTLSAGSRVIALTRSTDGAWIAVRDPLAVSRLFWVDATALTVGSGQPALATLPTGDCAIAALVAPGTDPDPAGDPTTPAVPPPGPSPQPQPPAPAPDTSAPTLGAAGVSYTPATGYLCTEQPSWYASVSVPASDDRGVTAVTATLSGSDSGSRSFVKNGGVWTLSPYTVTNATSSTDVVFTITARDAAGNTSAAAQAVVSREQCPG